jgi:chemotaxis protein CheX
VTNSTNTLPSERWDDLPPLRFSQFRHTVQARSWFCLGSAQGRACTSFPHCSFHRELMLVTPVAETLVEEVLARLNRRKDRESVSAPSAQENSLQDKLLDALSASTHSVFSTMCGWALEAGTPQIVPESHARHDISGIIAISGAVNATVVVSFEKEIAFSAAELFLGSRPEKINADVVDTVGELTNMIGGGAKERLKLDGLNLGLPTVVAGAGHYVAFESGVVIRHLPMTSEKGPLCIEFGLKF